MIRGTVELNIESKKPIKPVNHIAKITEITLFRLKARNKTGTRPERLTSCVL